MKSSYKNFFAIMLILLTWAVCSPGTAGNKGIEFSDGNAYRASETISTEISYCLDKELNYTIETIKNCAFQPRGNLPIARLAHSEFWIKAVIRTEQQSLHQLTVNIRPHFLYQVSLYESENNDWKIHHAGSKYPSGQAQSTLGGYTFLTNDLAVNQTELFLRIKTSGLIYTALTIEPYSLAVINKNNQQLGIGIQVGALIFVLLFLVTAHTLNPRLKLGRFTILMAIVLMCYLSGSGIISEYLLTDHPELNDSIFLGLFFLRVTGWVWVAQGILSSFKTPPWYRMTCILFYWIMFASLVLNLLGLNAVGGGLMLAAFFISHIVQVVAVIRTPDIPRLYKATMLVALVLSDLILALSLLLTQYPIVSSISAIYFSRIGDFVHPLILLVVILFGGKLVLTELNNTKTRLYELARETEIERALLNERKILVDMLTHEVRTPLGSIRLAINAIKKYFQANDSVDTKRFNNINQSLKNIDDIIEHCSLMNQIDQHTLEMQVERVDLNNFIKQYAAGLDDASLNRLHFKLQDRITINSDNYILKIIFSNLIENALKYSSPESTIHIDMSISEARDNNIVITVSNELDPKNIPDLNHIFDRYYRSPAVKNISGTGLGLHLSQELATRLGGQLIAFMKDGIISLSLSLRSGETT